eukprot:scaffold95484_cov27-Tisochrysis_lutea.AAC.1
MGTGTIATDFVRVLAAMPDAAVAAVGSRSAERAAAFAAELGVPTATTHGSYEELVADPQVDVIYIATPSSRHVSDSILCLQAGKPVLCEKSMAPTAEEADRVLKLARQRGIFFLHGVWSRFFPAMRAIREAIASGAIGTVYSAHASFCQVARAPLPSILCNGSITVRRPSMYMSHVPGARRSLADGAGCCSAMAETGIYCIQFLSWVFGGDAEVAGVSYDLDRQSGHDTHVAATVRFGSGGIGTLECSLKHASPREAVICGTRGVIRIPFPFWCPTRFTIQRMEGPASQRWSEPEVFEYDLPSITGPFTFVHSEGLAYEAAAVHRCLRAGHTEADEFTSDECIRVMRLVSQIRSYWQ